MHLRVKIFCAYDAAMKDSKHPLRLWRKANGLTQTQLGAALGVGVSHVCMIETGRRGTSIATAVKIDRLTGGAVPLESLLPTAREGAAA